MKYIRTYETEEKFLTDKDSTSRVFRLKPTLYKHSDADNGIYLELDDPRKHRDSTYMEVTISYSSIEFSFYIGNKSGDTQTTMTCTIDWGDGVVETKTINKDSKGFKLSHNYKRGNYKIELYDVERDYCTVGGSSSSLISPIESIRRAVLGNSVVSIGRYTFGTCDRLTSVNIPESVTSIGWYAFNGCNALTSVNIPESVTSIGNYVFNGCNALTSINIPESVTSIGESAFTSCRSLTSVNIPESVTSIGRQAFNGCSSLTSIYIPRSVTSIGRNAFKGCSSLTSIDIPEGVTTIDDGVFKNGTSLSSISFHSTTAPFINGFAFDSYLPDSGILHIKPGATGYDELLGGWFPPNWRIVEDL